MKRVPNDTAHEFTETWTSNASYLKEYGLYDPEYEHASCGVGMVVAIDGKPRREVVEAGVEALNAVWHRGAVDADGKTGDGAGINVEIPQDFFYEHTVRTGHSPGAGRIAVGMIFLPRTDLAGQEQCRCIVEAQILQFGYSIYGWRQVPINVDVIGEKANATRPEIEQIMIAGKPDVADDQFERDLYIIRRRIENQVIRENLNDFYICSLSCRSVIYKGMFLAEQVTEFYPDLLDERFVSRFAIYHQRYSTNTFPMWKLAQPFRMLAHNGEINTLSGNVNWMRSHETRLVSELLDNHIEDIKPVIQSGSSDSAALDAVFELLVRAGRTAPMVKSLMIPDAWSKKPNIPPEHAAFFSFCSCVMESWDGPAAICAADGDWVVAGMDRNGLRPLRYSLTDEGLLVVGSETGMVSLDEAHIIEKGRVGPGQSIAVNFSEGRFYHDDELRALLVASAPFEEWAQNITHLDHLIRPEDGETVEFDREELRRRQICAGYTLEELELLLQPMVDESKEAVGSMGDDTPLAVLSGHYRGLHHFFRQAFSQVTNPPIDSLREYRVMTLNTRLGNLGNILEQDESQTRLLQLKSPVLTNAEFEALQEYVGSSAVEIDCSFEINGGDNALKESMDRIRTEAENAVRGGAIHVTLTDKNIGPDRAPIPSILATSGVHSHLVRESLRTFTSINVRSAECLDTHYFAVLIGVGATTVNAYLAQEAIADRHRRGLFGDSSFDDCVARYVEGVNQGLLKIMSKMGISVVSPYRGAYKFEAVGLSRTLVSEYFPGMNSRISGIGLTGLQHNTMRLHRQAFNNDVVTLPIGGLYRYRRTGESHAFQGEMIHMLQQACDNDAYATYKKYSDAVNRMAPVSLRDLMDFSPMQESVPLEEVESITELRHRLVAPGISLGALGPEAHETLSIAMNRIGAKSDSGEGGEDPDRFQPRANGDNASSAI